MHGQKTSRIVAWTFLSPSEQEAWKKDFWVWCYAFLILIIAQVKL
jgi:23S rRNA A1618 N6-methylase RlmF